MSLSVPSVETSISPNLSACTAALTALYGVYQVPTYLVGNYCRLTQPEKSSHVQPRNVAPLDVYWPDSWLPVLSLTRTAQALLCATITPRCLHCRYLIDRCSAACIILSLICAEVGMSYNLFAI